MRQSTSTLERIIRAFLTALTVISGILAGLAFHFTGQGQPGAEMFGGGVFLMIATQAMQKSAGIRGFGCLLGVTWLAVIVVFAAL